MTKKVIASHLRVHQAAVQGHKMLLDPNDCLELSINGVYEPFETDLVKTVVREQDVVLDIGAHIGYYTLIFARLVGERGRVFAFEPDPTNFSLLKKNVKMNGYRNVILEQKAVSSQSGAVRLYLSDGCSGDHTVWDSGDGRNRLEVEAVRLDDYFAGYDGKVNFVKMDVEGAEGGVMRGMHSLLRRNQNIKIASEFWPFGLRAFGVEPQEYLELFEEYGFELYDINEREAKVECATVAGLLGTYNPELYQSYTNLLSVRQQNYND